jgi:hypothetical protein
MGLFGRKRVSDPNAFAQELIDAIRRAGVRAPIGYDAAGFKLTLFDGGSHELFLANAFAEYQAARRKDRKRVIDRYAWFARTPHGGPPENFEEARAHLRPRVRSRFEYEALWLQRELGATLARQISWRVIAEDYAVALAYDLPDAVQMVNDEQLATWNISLDDALKVARENLWAISKQDFVHVRPGLFMSPWRDNHDTARLMLHDLLWQLPVKGSHVAIPAHRDVLLVTGSDDEEGLLKAAEMAEQAISDTRGIAPLPLRLDATTWQPFAPSGAAELRYHNLRAHFMATIYTEQKELLQKLHEKLQLAVFVASPMLVESRATQRSSSVVAWGKGVDALLPKVDWIGFMDVPRGGQTRYIAWDAAYAVIGSLMEPAGRYPERYHVQTYPGEDQFARMPWVGQLG